MNIAALAWILFFISGVLYVIGYIPDMKSMYEDKSVKGVSLLFWELVIITVSYSFYSLVLTGGTVLNTVVVGANLALAIVILVWKNILRYSIVKGIVYTIIYFAINISIYFYLGLPLYVLQTIATVSIILAYIDQIVQFLKHKTAKGTNPYLYLILGLAIFFLLLNLALNQDYVHVIITELVNLILIMVCCHLSFKYIKQDNKVDGIL